MNIIKHTQQEIEKALECSIAHRDYMISEAKAAIFEPFIQEEIFREVTKGYGAYKINYTLEFIKYASLEQFKKHSDFFKSQKDNVFFQQLLFDLTFSDSDFKAVSKLKSFLDWGYPVNIVLHKNYHNIHHSNWIASLQNATLLHVHTTAKILDMLVKKGADIKAKCFMNKEYEIFTQKGFQEINSPQAYELLYELLKKDIHVKYPYLRELNSDEKSSEDFSARHIIGWEALALHNKRIKMAAQSFTPYELALSLGQRPKFLALKKYESNEVLEQPQKEVFDKIVEYIKTYPGRKQTAMKQVFQVLKQKNDYALEHLELVKKAVTPKLVFLLIKDGHTKAVEKIIENNWVKKGVKHPPTQEDFMQFAAKYSRTDIFKFLDKMGHNDSIDAVFSKLNQRLLHPNFKDVTSKNAKTKFKGMPNGVIYYLVEDKRYYFENQILLKYVIDLEKEKIAKELAEMQKQDTNQKKKVFKM